MLDIRLVNEFTDIQNMAEPPTPHTMLFRFQVNDKQHSVKFHLYYQIYIENPSWKTRRGFVWYVSVNLRMSTLFFMEKTKKYIWEWFFIFIFVRLTLITNSVIGLVFKLKQWLDLGMEIKIPATKREQIKEEWQNRRGNGESGGRTCGGDDRAASENRSRHHCM